MVAVGLIAAVLAAVLALLTLLGPVLEGSRAQAAADAAALAGAVELRHGRARGAPDQGVACAIAAHAAARARARLTVCSADGESGEVSVTVDGGVVRSAVAGPAGPGREIDGGPG